MITTERIGDWIQVFGGNQLFPLDCRVEEIDIEAIAHSLAMQCRFNGHTSKFYSVAEHCAHAHDLVPEVYRLEALLHDASEAYLCDLPRPLKKSGEIGRLYQVAENDLMQIISHKFDFQWLLPIEVCIVDDELLHAEALQLMQPLHPDFGLPGKPANIILPCWNPTQARFEFMERFRQCCRQGEY